MGLAFIHNPDWLAADQLDLVFDWVDPVAVVTPNGYIGTKGLTASGGAGLVRKVLGFQEPTYFYVGCRFQITAQPAANRVVIGVTDSRLTVHCCISVNTDLSLALRRGTSVNDEPLRWGVVEGVNIGTWIRLGFKGILGYGYAGMGEIWINNNPAVQVDEIPTMADDGLPGQGGICIGVAPEFITGHYYMVDAGTAGQKDLCHDLVIGTQYSDSTSPVNTFTATGAPSVHEATDDMPTHDSDATVAKGEDQFMVHMGPQLSASYSRVYGARLNMIAKSVKATHTAARFCHYMDDGKVYPMPNPRGIQADIYQHAADLTEMNPKTNAPWKLKDMLGAHVGFRVE